MTPADSTKVIAAKKQSKGSLSAEDLCIDAAAETERICAHIKNYMVKVRRRGAVIGLSGGIDSSVTAALCARALGKSRVFGLLMPERHSAAETSSLGFKAAAALGIDAQEHNISQILEASGCYLMQERAV